MDILDSARVDGCSFLGACRHVMVPLLGTPFGILAIVAAMGALDDIAEPVIAQQPWRDLMNGNFAMPGGSGSAAAFTGGEHLALAMAGILLATPFVTALILFAQRFSSTRGERT